MLNRIILAIVILMQAGAAAAVEQEWRFRVFLDDKEIGYHDFVLEEVDNQLRL